jgi:hypothetical protein
LNLRELSFSPGKIDAHVHNNNVTAQCQFIGENGKAGYEYGQTYVLTIVPAWSWKNFGVAPAILTSDTNPTGKIKYKNCDEFKRDWMSTKHGTKAPAVTIHDMKHLSRLPAPRIAIA